MNDPQAEAAVAVVAATAALMQGTTDQDTAAELIGIIVGGVVEEPLEFIGAQAVLGLRLAAELAGYRDQSLDELLIELEREARAESDV